MQTWMHYIATKTYATYANLSNLDNCMQSWIFVGLDILLQNRFMLNSLYADVATVSIYGSVCCI
jgi:hypothetical protein